MPWALGDWKRLASPYDASQVSDRVTISGGAATVAPPHVAAPDDLLRAADQALYRAKGQGRNRLAVGGIDITKTKALELAS